MIKHHAFFEALGNIEEKSPEWNLVFAGLSVLRLVDRLAESRGSGEPAEWLELETSRRSVEAISVGDPRGTILRRAIDSIAGHSAITAELGAELLAYGKSLDRDAKWGLAVDVFQGISELFSARTHPRLVIEASTALGSAARNAGDWITSERGYARAEHLAESHGDRAAALTVQVGLANSEMIRGNLQAAESEIEKVLEEAEALNMEPVRAIALHTRASLAHLKGDYQRAIHNAYRSLELTTNASARDRILGDIAAAYAGLGMRDTARSGYSIVAMTSPHQSVRWQATLNLMELAIQEGDEKSFDDAARQMQSAQLDPRLNTYFLFFQAMGAQRFERGNAQSLFEKARAFAERNKLHQLEFEIEAEMFREPSFPSVENPEELMRIAEVLEHLREAASS